MDEKSVSAANIPSFVAGGVMALGVSYQFLFPAYLGDERLKFEVARRDTAAWTKANRKNNCYNSVGRGWTV